MESNQTRESWNKGKRVGQKPFLKPKDIGAVNVGHTQGMIELRFVWPLLA